MALVCLQMQMFLMANRTQTLTRWDELVGFLPLPAGLLDSLFHEVVHLRCAWKQSASWYAQLPAMRMHHHAFCVGLPVSSGNCSHSKGPCLGMHSGSRATCLLVSTFSVQHASTNRVHSKGEWPLAWQGPWTGHLSEHWHVEHEQIVAILLSSVHVHADLPAEPLAKGPPASAVTCLADAAHIPAASCHSKVC